MIQSIEIKLNTILMSDILYTYDMYNYNIKHNAEFFYDNKVKKFPVASHKTNVWKNWQTVWHVGTTFAMFAPQVETLARSMARWNVNMRI